MQDHSGPLGAIAERWFEVMRACGDDVRELLHDGHPTACVGEGAFGYVNAFTAHVNVGFFNRAALTDSTRLLEGTGKYMRHVKLKPGREIDAAALEALIEAAYRNELTRLCDAVPELLRSVEPDAALRGWMDRYIDYMTTKSGMAAGTAMA